MAENKETKIVSLLSRYLELIKEAEELEYISTKSFIGDITESLACIKLGVEKSKNSQKGYDALRGKERIQIKYRSKGRSGKYKITFKNISKNSLGFDTLVFCSVNSDKIQIFEMPVDLIYPHLKFKDSHSKAVFKIDQKLIKENENSFVLHEINL